MVGVRLGIPDVPAGVKPQRQARRNAPNAGPAAGKTRGGTTSSKGNPQRKSQWATHPLYQEYSRLKKVVEAQAKEARTSFNLVDTPERRAYQQAFSQWLEAKSSFRGHGESGQDRVKPGEKKEESDEESDEEEDDRSGPTPSPQRNAEGSSRPAATGNGKSVSPPAKAAGKSGSPPGKGKSVAK
jgi:hypothetical protein